MFILWIQMAVVLLFSIPASLLVAREPWVPLTTHHGLVIGYITIFVSIGCTTVQVFFQKLTDTTRAGLIYSLEPVFAAILAYLFLGELLTFRGLIGAGFIFIALIISEMKGRDKSK
jgi:drug/metabolite transporter (DMT)-like permease